MTDAEIFPFMDTLRDVARIFPLRADEHDLKQLGASYFKALRRYPLDLVQAGAQRCIDQGKHFPKPAEWLDQIPRATTRTHALDELAAADRDDWLAAERKVWEDAPCRCRDCVAADVSTRPLRFVPHVTADGSDARAQLGERIVVRGHWAHGDELARWYAAKARFWSRFRAALPGTAMAAVYVDPPIAREPGEEG